MAFLFHKHAGIDTRGPRKYALMKKVILKPYKRKKKVKLIRKYPRHAEREVE
jgi:hypothetical protein